MSRRSVWPRASCSTSLWAFAGWWTAGCPSSSWSRTCGPPSTWWTSSISWSGGRSSRAGRPPRCATTAAWSKRTWERSSNEPRPAAHQRRHPRRGLRVRGHRLDRPPRSGAPRELRPRPTLHARRVRRVVRHAARRGGLWRVDSRGGSGHGRPRHGHAVRHAAARGRAESDQPHDRDARLWQRAAGGGGQGLRGEPPVAGESTREGERALGRAVVLVAGRAPRDRHRSPVRGGLRGLRRDPHRPAEPHPHQHGLRRGDPDLRGGRTGRRGQHRRHSAGEPRTRPLHRVLRRPRLPCLYHRRRLRRAPHRPRAPPGWVIRGAMTPRARSSRWLRMAGGTAAAVAAFYLPALAGGSAVAYSTCATIAIFAVMAYGTDLVLSYLGEVSLGHTIFWAGGGYVTALLATRLGWN